MYLKKAWVSLFVVVVFFLLPLYVCYVFLWTLSLFLPLFSRFFSYSTKILLALPRLDSENLARWVGKMKFIYKRAPNEWMRELGKNKIILFKFEKFFFFIFLKEHKCIHLCLKTWKIKCENGPRKRLGCKSGGEEKRPRHDREPVELIFWI